MTHQIAPNLLAVGAAKSGTSSLAALLKRHPEVFVPERKEPAFFNGREADGGVADRKTYLRMFQQGSGRKRIGDFSTGYLFEPSAALAIRRFLGEDVKIVILLREPAAVAHSLWQHQVRLGLESLDFADALKTEKERSESPLFARSCPGWAANFFYAQRADYYPQVQRFIEVFGRERVGVFLFEEFFRDGLPKWEALCRFLDISPSPRPDNIHKNEGGAPRFEFVNKAMFSQGMAKRLAKVVVPEPVRARLAYRLSEWNSKPEGKRRIDPALRSELIERFRPNVAALSRLLDRDLEGLWWRS